MARLYFASLTRNKTSLVGSALLLGALTMMLSLIFIQLMGLRGGAYLGIITFLVLPTVAGIGLVLILLGIRRARTLGPLSDEEAARKPFPVLDFNNVRTRKATLGLIGLSTVSVVLLAGATFKGLEVMDSVEFCGTACHSWICAETGCRRARRHTLRHNTR